MEKDFSVKDWLHYVIVFGVLAGTWTWLMATFNGDLTMTIVASFFIFVATDKIMHKALNV